MIEREAGAYRHGLAVVTIVGTLALSAGGALAQTPAEPQDGTAPVTAEELKNAIESIKARLNRQRQSQDVEPAESAFSEELRAANEEIATLRAEIERLRIERDSLNSGLLAAHDREGSLQARIDELDGELARSRVRDKEALAAAGAEQDRLEQELASARADLERLDQIVQNERNLRTDESTARTQAETRITELAESLEALRGELAQVDSGRERDRERHAAELARSAQRLDEAQARARNAEVELASLREVAQSSVTEVQQMGEQLLALIAQNQELSQVMTELRASKDLLEAELGDARAEIARYAGDADALRRKLLLSTSEDTEAVRAIDTPQPAAAASTEALPVAQAGGDDPAVIATADPGPQDGGLQTLAALEVEETPPPAPALSNDGMDALIARLGVVRTQEGLVATPRDLVFGSGNAELVSGSEPVLDDLALLIDNLQPSAVRIVGHTDDRGDPAFNQSLSRERADVIATALEARGVADPASLAIEGRGSSDPIASNDTPAGREANRRVEIVIDLVQ